MSSTKVTSWPPELAQPLLMPCGATKIVLLCAVGQSPQPVVGPVVAVGAAGVDVVRGAAVPVEAEDQPVRVVVVVVGRHPQDVAAVLAAARDRVRAAGQRRRLAAAGGRRDAGDVPAPRRIRRSSTAAAARTRSPSGDGSEYRRARTSLDRPRSDIAMPPRRGDAGALVKRLRRIPGSGRRLSRGSTSGWRRRCRSTAAPGAVGGGLTVDVQAEPGLDADDGAVGRQHPLLVGAAGAVPDLHRGPALVPWSRACRHLLPYTRSSPAVVGVKLWFAPPLQSQICVVAPLVGEAPAMSRQRPDWLPVSRYVGRPTARSSCRCPQEGYQLNAAVPVLVRVMGSQTGSEELRSPEFQRSPMYT